MSDYLIIYKNMIYYLIIYDIFFYYLSYVNFWQQTGFEFPNYIKRCFHMILELSDNFSAIAEPSVLQTYVQIDIKKRVRTGIPYTVCFTNDKAHLFHENPFRTRTNAVVF